MAESILATFAFLVLLRYVQELFVSVVASVLIAFALNPFVTLLERLRVHRTIAAAIRYKLSFQNSQRALLNLQSPGRSVKPRLRSINY